MRKYLLVILFMQLVASGKLAANTIVVSSIAALQHAIENAKPGDTILLADGVYTTTTDITISSAGTIKQPITISAEHAAAAEINGSGGFVLVSPAAYVI